MNIIASWVTLCGNTVVWHVMKLALSKQKVDDALHRKESCGGHFREESQTEEGEALRDDANFAYVAAWEYTGENMPEQLNKEPLVYENVKLTQRSYK